MAATTRPGPLTPVGDALARLAAALAPVPAREAALAEAAGRVLAEPLVVAAPVPPRAVALRDGWAVAAADTVGASPYGPVVLANAPAFVRAGEPLPEGTDALLPPDAVVLGAFAEASESAAPGEGVRRPGADAAAGHVLRPAGVRLRPLDLAAAGAAGLSRCTVRIPVLGLAGESPGLDLLARLAAQSGFSVSRVGSADASLRVIARGPGEAGPLAELALRPGEAAFGVDPAVVAVPARLDGALAAWLVLLRPLLERAAGAAPVAPRSGPLRRKIASAVGLTELALLRADGDGFDPLAVGDLPLSAIAAADAFLAVPPSSEGYAAGETVRAFPL